MSEDLIRWATQVRADLNDVGASLVDLEADPATALLQRSGLRGATAVAARQGAEALAGAWALLPAVGAVLDGVEEERQKGRRADEARIAALLTGPSVEVAPGLAPRSATLTVRAAMAQLLRDRMIATDVVARIGTAWREGLSTLDATRRRFESVETSVAQDGGPVAEAAAARAALAAAESAAAEDPLGLTDTLPHVVAAVDAAVAAAATLVARRANLHQDLAAAEADLDRLDDAIRQGAMALDAAREKIRDPQGLLAPLDPIAVLDADSGGLRPWLTRVKAVAASDWRAALNGLEAWRTVAHGAAEAAARVLDANRRAVGRRDELRGLLDALAAKAAARGYAEQPALAAAHRRAKELLWSAPCDLDDAAAAVSAFAGALREASKARTS